MTRYELLDRIGVGGMAEIFRGKAVAAGGFEKPVAIKRILPHLSQDKRFVELLIAEAKVLSLLKHRNIVQIFDVGLGDDGQYFLVMEYVDGRDLGAVQRGNEALRRRIPFDLALHVGAEICEALEHAHSARAPDGKPMSLVHRDLSPSNVLLSRAGEVKLTDFGIAKRAESEQTGSGAVRGKFAYISPEQARNEHVEPRSDVFSVGILIWEMVTGQRLFSKLGDLESLRAVREAAVQRPTAADPKLPDVIDKLLLGALNKDPKRRPTAGQFGEQLRSLRYSLEDSGGDPATQLAQMIDDAERHERESSESIPLAKLNPFSRLPGAPPQRAPKTGFEPEGTESTVIRIRTAAEFALLADESIVAARQVIDRFEEEETRLAALSSDQLRFLRDARRDSDAEIEPPTQMRAQIAQLDPLSRASPLPHGHFDVDEATRIVAPTRRRTPVPERLKRAPTVPPPLPGMTAPRRPGASTHPPLPGMPAPIARPMPIHPVDEYVPSAVHHRHPTANPSPVAPHIMQMQPMPPTPMPPMGPPMGQHPAWGYVPGPTAAGSPHARRQQGSAFQPWMLIVGAIIMAAAAFLLTRLLIRG